MFGLTKREQRWKAEQQAAELLCKLVVELVKAANPSPTFVEQQKPLGMQYFYKVDRCRAINADSEDCICWHDCGSGPFPDAKPGGQSVPSKWRNKP